MVDVVCRRAAQERHLAPLSIALCVCVCVCVCVCACGRSEQPNDITNITYSHTHPHAGEHTRTEDLPFVKRRVPKTYDWLVRT
jgi:hypothetical protein